MSTHIFHYELKKALFGSSLGMAEHRRFEILIAATDIIKKKGFEALQFKELAKKCKISRALVHHYFKDKTDLANSLLDLSTNHLRLYVKEALTKSPQPKQQLSAYCESTLNWAIEHNQVAISFLHFLNLSMHNIEMRKRNDQLSFEGRERIKTFITQLDNFSSLDRKAILIQTLLTGCIFKFLSENHSDQIRFKMTQNCVNECMSIALS